MSSLKEENQSLLSQNAYLIDNVEKKRSRNQLNSQTELESSFQGRTIELNSTQAEISELRAQIAQSKGDLKPIDFQKVFSLFDKSTQRARELIRRTDFILIGTIYSLIENSYLVGSKSVSNRLRSIRCATFGREYGPKPDGSDKFFERMMNFNRSVMQSNIENLKKEIVNEFIRYYNSVFLSKCFNPENNVVDNLVQLIQQTCLRLEKYGKMDDGRSEILADLVSRFIELGVYASLMDSPKVRVGESIREDFVTVRDYSRSRVEKALTQIGFCDEFGMPSPTCKVLPGLFVVVSDGVEECKEKFVLME
ncbi:hypothetical protein HK098_003753 [Nowakowskiella sp. JEL0407]|nr:hypothetical protein HK098_003753 [Nowakowskiella sp. JEL0407]